MPSPADRARELVAALRVDAAETDREGGFPEDFYFAMAKAGWLGIAMPTEYGGSGLGISEAALMMEAVSGSGAGLSGASAIHMNVFGLHPVVVNGSDEQKRHAFAETYRILALRIGFFANLPVDKLDRMSLKKELDGIGKK